MNSTESAVKAFVSEAAASKIVVKLIDDNILELFLRLGFSVALSEKWKVCSISVSNDGLKAKIFETLRDEGICFSGGKDWCPADVFEFLRDENFLSGSYRKIVWTGPGEPIVMGNC